MRKLIDWIKRHQLVAFFAIAFAITWGLGFSYGAVLRRGQFSLLPLVYLATCGPALAGIILTALANTEARQGTRKAFWIAFLVAWVVSALVFLANSIFFNHLPLSFKMVRLALVSVLPVAFVIGMAHSGIPAVRGYLASLIRLRGVWGWSALALVVTPALILLSVPISSTLGRQAMTAQQLPNTGVALIGLVTVKFFYQLFFFNATGEEAGWRGFALPRLQTRTSPLIAALILALFWVPWHFFLWRAEGNPVFGGRFWIEQYLIHILFSLLIVWIYNRAHGSILVAGITHAAANTALAFVPKIDFQILCAIMAVAVLVFILADRMWKKLPPGHPGVYRSPESAAQPGGEPTSTLAS
jgi:membrane protease YdiL (CAAX protease family)